MMGTGQVDLVLCYELTISIQLNHLITIDASSGTLYSNYNSQDLIPHLVTTVVNGWLSQMNMTGEHGVLKGS